MRGDGSTFDAGELSDHGGAVTCLFTFANSRASAANSAPNSVTDNRGA